MTTRPITHIMTTSGGGSTVQYPSMKLSGEYGWQLPIDVLLDAANNGLHIDISFHSNESSWEGGYYMVKPDNRNDYRRWVGMNDISPVQVSTGYWECNVTNQMLVNGLSAGNIAWLNGLKNDGYTYVFTHPAAFQPYRFTDTPRADFVTSTGGVTTVRRPLAIFEEESYNPLNLPPYTIRLKFMKGVTPTFSKGTAVQVSSSPNVWDLTYENTDWELLCGNKPDLIEIMGANAAGVTDMNQMFDSCALLMSVPNFDTTNVTDMHNMFKNCWHLTSVPLFDTSKVTNMSKMFYDCEALAYIPLFNTSKVTNMDWMFFYCTNVQSGALALYQQASSQATPPSDHYVTFNECGANTTTGAAELAQIPSGWK